MRTFNVNGFGADSTTAWDQQPQIGPGQVPGAGLINPNTSPQLMPGDASYDAGQKYLAEQQQRQQQMFEAGMSKFGKYAGIAVAVSAVSAGLSAYHGYKRHHGSVGAAIGWGLLGLLFAPIPPIVALIQGFGKAK